MSDKIKELLTVLHAAGITTLTVDRMDDDGTRHESSFTEMANNDPEAFEELMKNLPDVTTDPFMNAATIGPDQIKTLYGADEPFDQEKFDSHAAQQVFDPKVVNDFEYYFDQVQESVNANAHNKGFYDTPSDPGTRIALIHSEASEALEALRKPELEGKLEHHSLFAEELADIVIRVMDMAHEMDVDLSGALIQKAQYNTTRAKMHGNKKF